MLALLLPAGYIGLLHAPLSAELFDFMRDSPLIRARTTRSRERKERKAGGWFEFLFFFADLYPPRPRRQRGIKRETRESLTANLISPRNVRSRLFWTFVGLIEAN